MLERLLLTNLSYRRAGFKASFSGQCSLGAARGFGNSCAADACILTEHMLNPQRLSCF